MTLIIFQSRVLTQMHNSNMGYNLVNTMMKETFGITLKAKNTKFMIFDESFWNEIKDNNVTYLNSIK